MVLLTLLSAALVLIVLLVIAVALTKISSVLRSIGGTPTSYLAKLRMGLRAIESETGHLTPQVLRLNEGLSAVAGGLDSVDGHLVGTINAAVAQPRYDVKAKKG
jgi:predicted PurR-regulated permease PerM